MSKRFFSQLMAGIAGVALLTGMALAQDDATQKRGRKYKAPPVTARIEVLVQRARDGKPLVNAAVIFHSVKDGKDEGNLEVKTGTDGKAMIDIIPVGSQLRVQVIANGYATFGQDYDLPSATKEIVVEMKRPTEQYSTYRDANDKEKGNGGVQEPIRPTEKPKPPTPGVLPITAPATTEPQKTATPAATTPAPATTEQKPQ
jgi:hypothetical protein